MFAPKDDPACQRQRTVEPRIEDGAAVKLCIEADAAAFAFHLRCRLDAEARRVAMSRYQTESGFGQGRTTLAEGEQGRTILPNEVTLPCFQLRIGQSAV